jgi:hypothetical protein
MSAVATPVRDDAMVRTSLKSLVPLRSPAPKRTRWCSTAPVLRCPISVAKNRTGSPQCRRHHARLSGPAVLALGAAAGARSARPEAYWVRPIGVGLAGRVMCRLCRQSLRYNVIRIIIDLAAAADHARRRIEPGLHDGTQRRRFCPASTCAVSRRMFPPTFRR